jgi:hypothetical protein
MITDDQVATALRQAGDAVPLPAPVPLDDVRAAVTHRRRVRAGVLTGTAVAVAAVLVASPVLRGGGSQDVAPVQPATSPTQVAPNGPRTTHTATVDDLSITTEGPVVIVGSQPTGVVMRVTNHGAEPWTGQLGVGLSESNSLANGNSPALYPASGQPTLQGYGVLLADNQNSIDGVLDQTAVTIAPGGTRRLEVVVRADSGLLTRDLLTGWVPVVVPGGLGAARYPDPSSYPLLHAVTDLATGPGQPLVTANSYVRGGDAAHPGALVAVDLENDGAEPVTVTDVRVVATGVDVRGAAVSATAEQAALTAAFPGALDAADAIGPSTIPALRSGALVLAVRGECAGPASAASATVTVTYTVGAQTTPRTLVLPTNLGTGADWLPTAVDLSCASS